MDRRTFPCPDCRGERGWEGPYCHIDYRDGSAWGDWHDCPTCDGTGEVVCAEAPVMVDDDLPDWFDAPVPEPSDENVLIDYDAMAAR